MEAYQMSKSELAALVISNCEGVLREGEHTFVGAAGMA